MKKWTAIALSLVMALSLAACAPAKGKEEAVRVKCPACGYEFQAPAQR